MEKDEEKIVKQNDNENEINQKEDININNDETQDTYAAEHNSKEEKKVSENMKREHEITVKENIKVENKKTDIKKYQASEPKEGRKEKNKHKKESNVPAKKIFFIAISIIFLLFISTIFAILNINNSNIINGVYIEELNLSNLSKDEAANKVKEKINNIEDIELSYGEYNTIVKLEEIGLEISSKQAINNAINLGKTNNIIVDNYSILLSNIFKTKFDLDIKIDEGKFEETIKNIQAEIPDAIKEYSYDIKEDELIITNGKSGQKIIKEELRKAIISNIKEQFNGNITIISIPTKIEEPKKINIEKIYNEIYKEAQDAYIVEAPFELHKEENGIDFAITMGQAKEILKENKGTYIIPLKISEPKIRIEDLGDKLFKQTLAKYTTIYDAGVINRAHNIALAAKTINGTILMPGETFSYNGVLGNTNKEKGYKLGTAYVGGKVVESYGGGICQVSSTLYNSVLYANLEIVERYNHSYVVNYVPAGRDATVAYGGKDFKFKNTRNYPIKIVASAKNGVVSISIMGIKEETEYEVVLTSTVLSTTPRLVKYENNSSLEEGTQKVIQKGYDGKKSIAYKILKLNGKTISKTVLSKDTYKPMTKIVQVGTKTVSQQVTAPTVESTTIDTNIITQ